MPSAACAALAWFWRTRRRSTVRHCWSSSVRCPIRLPGGRWCGVPWCTDGACGRRARCGIQHDRVRSSGPASRDVSVAPVWSRCMTGRQRRRRETPRSTNCSRSLMPCALVAPGSARVRNNAARADHRGLGAAGDSGVTDGQRSPNRDRLLRTARLLRPLLGELVFVGGQVAELLVTDAAAVRVRPTDDVDVVVPVTTRTGIPRPAAATHGVGIHAGPSRRAPRSAACGRRMTCFST